LGWIDHQLDDSKRPGPGHVHDAGSGLVYMKRLTTSRRWGDFCQLIPYGWISLWGRTSIVAREASSNLTEFQE